MDQRIPKRRLGKSNRTDYQQAYLLAEETRRQYLADRQRKTTPLKTWALVLTPEQQAEQEKMIRDGEIPF